jgi:DNA helicase-2/ATP-dependent DNA helicase PcrA
VGGDDDQTIRQWRGSAVKNILTFTTRHSGARTVTLNENFRSSQAVVNHGRRVAAGTAPSRRLSKTMIASRHQSYERGDWTSPSVRDRRRLYGSATASSG